MDPSFPILAVACVAGCLLPLPYALACSVALSVAAFQGSRTILFAAAVALALASLDVALRDPVTRSLPNGLVTVSGIATEAPESTRAPFVMSGTPYGMLEVRALGAVQAGERISVRGRLLRTESLQRRGITALLDGRVVARERGGGFAAWAARTRAWTLRRLSILPQPAAALLDGALIGERGELDERAAEAFSETGTTHVLVTAGLHLGAFAAMLLFVCEALGAGRIAASLLALAGVGLFMVLSGAHLPAMRAGIMVSCALLARACGRAPLGAEAIGVAAIVVSLWEPWAVRGASFALSFSCVVAIAFFAGPIASALERVRLPYLMCEGLALTLATQIGVWPLQAAFFLQLAPYAPLANALVVPMVAPALAFGMFTVIHPVFAPLAAVACGWILGAVRAISALPFAHLVATPPPWWTIAVYDLTAIWLGMRRTWVAAIALACAAALCLWPPRLRDSVTHIIALDVGQGQSIVVLS